MPPKKVIKEEKKILLGRPGNNLKIGIVGMPNVGKSTLFNVMCKMDIPAENFPFCTIDPNVSRVPVPDARWDELCEHHKPASRVPAYLTITDIAGLVKGAHEGEGLGNAFLSHIRAVDGIFQVLRTFADDEVTHVEGNVDPVRDLEIIHNELRLKDISTIETSLSSLVKEATRNKKLKVDVEIMEKVLEFLKSGKDVRFGDWNAKEIEILNPLQLLTAKPVVYLVNMSVAAFSKKRSKWLVKVKKWIDANGGEPIIPFCAALEKSLVTMDADQQAEYLTSLKVESSISKIILIGYHTLNLIHFFTCGSDEVRCWTIQKGTCAQDAAGVIHTDFIKGFQNAEVYNFKDFKEFGSENEVKANGKYLLKGKAYVVEDGDIIFFKVNTSGRKKK